MAEQTKIRMTIAEYEALPDSRHPIQLIEGELVDVVPPVPLHQDVVFEVGSVLRQLRPDGHMYISPLAVVLDAQNVLQPDVMWLAPDTKCAVTNKRVEGAPDLVVEVLSPSTARYDKSVKFLLYEKYGTREYWLINLDRLQIEIWKRDRNEFVLLGTFGATESFVSPLLGQTVDLAAIFPARQ